jgi:hypothetical protein
MVARLYSIAAVSTLASCATPLTATPGELAMVSHPLAGDSGAVILERTGAVILDYSEAPGVDNTGGGRATVKAIQTGGGSLGGGQSDDASPHVAELFARNGVGSYSLEVTQRCKILNENGMQCTRVAERLPSDSELGYVEGTTFLPDGTTVALDPSSVEMTEEGIRFELPGAAVGAICAFRYKIFTQELGLLGWVFDGALPVAKAEYRVKLRRDTPVPFRFRPADETRTVTPKRRPVAGKQVGGQTEWIIWTVDALPPVEKGGDETVLVFGD